MRPASGMSIFDTDVSPAVAEARLLHPKDHGYFTVAAARAGGRWQENHFPLSSLDAVATSIRGNADTYISQASFATKLRRGFNTKSLRCAFVDLDTYNRPGNDSPQELAAQVIDRARALGVPDPSYIASSGRGLYAKWVFDDPVGAGLLPNWKLLQKKLVSAYLPMGADPKVIDPTRVLRLQETVNSKSGLAVSLIHEGKTHSFADLFRQAEPLEILKRTPDGKIVKGRSTVVHRGETLNAQQLASDEALSDLDALGLYAGQREPVMMARMGLQSLNWYRFLDLRDLVIQRGGIRRGSRDAILFWMVSFLAQARIINPTNFWSEVQALLASFPVGHDFNPMQDGSLSTLLERIKSQAKGEKCFYDGQGYNAIYTPANDTLINLLSISREEEAGLRTIISDTEKRKRADDKVPGRAERRFERQEAREAAVELLAQGMTQSDIARTLGKNRSTIGRWLTPESSVGRPYIETRGRRRRAAKPHTRLTGRGPIPMGPMPASDHPSCQATGTRPMTTEELKARTKVRQQKAHLCAKRERWSTHQLRQWLDDRRLVLHRRSQARAASIEVASEASISAQADRLVAELIEHLRRGVRCTTDQISISGSGTLSSSPTTGPPLSDPV